MGDSMLAKLNAELTKRGLPGFTVVSVKSKKSDLSDGAVAGMVIGSVACATILFGAAVYLTKMNNKSSSEYLAAKAKAMTKGAQKKSEEREDAAGEVGRKSNDKNHSGRVSEEGAGVQGVRTDTPAKTGMIST
jgi:mannitol-specific phosphotransferase system IIBC component